MITRSRSKTIKSSDNTNNEIGSNSQIINTNQDEASQSIKNSNKQLKQQLEQMKIKYQQAEKEKDVLKQGNTYLIDNLLFNHSEEDFIRMKKQLIEKNLLIEELKKQINQHKCNNEINNNNNNNVSFTQENTETKSMRSYKSSKTTRNNPTNQGPSLKQYNALKIQYQNAIMNNTQLEQNNFLLGQDIESLTGDIQKLKEQLQKKQSTQQCKDNSITDQAQQGLKKINKENAEYIRKLQKQIKSKESIIHDNQSQITQLNKQISKVKVQNNQLVAQTKQLKEVEQILKRQLKQVQRQKQMQKQKYQQKYLKQYDNYKNQDQISEIQSLNQSKVSYSSSNYQKLNKSFEKNQRIYQDKIKKLNQQLSKQKLDKMRGIQQLTTKIQRQQKNYTESIHRSEQQIKRLSSRQTINSQINKAIANLREELKKQKTEKQQILVEKNILKEIIIQMQNKADKLAEQHELLSKQYSNIQQFRQNSSKQQNSHFNKCFQLQQKIVQLSNFNQQLINTNEKQSIKYKNLQTMKEQKEKQFTKQVKYYQQLIQQYKRLSFYNQTKGKDVSSYIRSDNQSKLSLQKQRQNNLLYSNNNSKISKESNHDYNESQISQQFKLVECQQKLKSCMQQISKLKQQIKFQNQQYNVLQNSNKQLRKQLIKMIQNEQKLRKDLIGQRVKNRTNRSSSKSIASNNSFYNNHRSSQYNSHRSISGGKYLQQHHQFHHHHLNNDNNNNNNVSSNEQLVVNYQEYQKTGYLHRYQNQNCQNKHYYEQMTNNNIQPVLHRNTTSKDKSLQKQPTHYYSRKNSRQILFNKNGYSDDKLQQNNNQVEKLNISHNNLVNVVGSSNQNRYLKNMNRQAPQTDRVVQYQSGYNNTIKDKNNLADSSINQNNTTLKQMREKRFNTKSNVISNNNNIEHKGNSDHNNNNNNVNYSKLENKKIIQRPTPNNNNSQKTTVQPSKKNTSNSKYVYNPPQPIKKSKEKETDNKSQQKQQNNSTSKNQSTFKKSDKIIQKRFPPSPLKQQQQSDHRPLSAQKSPKKQSSQYTDNQQINFQISSSKSNLSNNRKNIEEDLQKQDKISQENVKNSLQWNEGKLNKQSTEQAHNNQRPQQQGNNFVKSKIQSTKSSGEIRFMRKNYQQSNLLNSVESLTQKKKTFKSIEENQT